jgi:PAS domain S-box-containing protein
MDCIRCGSGTDDSTRAENTAAVGEAEVPGAKGDPAGAARGLEYLLYRDSVLSAVSDVAARCLNGEDTESDLPANLETLGRAAGANRVTLVQKAGSAGGRPWVESVGEWTEMGFPPNGEPVVFRPKVGCAPIRGLERWERELGRGEVVAGCSASFPAEERELLESEGIRSVAIVPVFVGGTHWGHICFDRAADEEWHPEVLSALRIAASLIGAAIRHKRDREELEARVQERTLALAEANRTARESEKLYRSLVDTSPDAIVLFDLEYRILMANPSSLELFGCSGSATLTGELAPTWMWPDDRALADRYHREMIESGCVRDAAVLFHRRDGSSFDAEVSAALIRDAAGEPRYILHVTRDVTRQKRLERHLHQAQKMDAVGRLASGIAHDFNNILTVVKGFGELLAKRLTPTSFPHYMATEIVGASERAAALVERLLAFSRKQMVEPKPLRVNPAIEEMRGMLRALLREDIQLATCLSPEAGSICIDSGQFDQLIVNLAVNARDAMPTGGTLTVSTRCATSAGLPSAAGLRPGAYVVLEVNDTGTGMTEEVRSHIFEPFFTTKEVGKGTGLGLATVYGIVQQSGGHVEVESLPGAGCTFRIYIPRTDPAQTASVAIARTRSTSECRETILVTENERAVRALMVTTLTECGYTVLEAENGVQALEAVEQHGDGIDLLLTDVVMPQMGGLELWGKLEGRFPAMRVLYTSGYTDKVVAGFPAFLKKPFSPEALAAKVQEVFREAGRNGAACPGRATQADAVPPALASGLEGRENGGGKANESDSGPRFQENFES